MRCCLALPPLLSCVRESQFFQPKLKVENVPRQLQVSCIYRLDPPSPAANRALRRCNVWVFERGTDGASAPSPDAVRRFFNVAESEKWGPPLALQQRIAPTHATIAARFPSPKLYRALSAFLSWRLKRITPTPLAVSRLVFPLPRDRACRDGKF